MSRSYARSRSPHDRSHVEEVEENLARRYRDKIRRMEADYERRLEVHKQQFASRAVELKRNLKDEKNKLAECQNQKLAHLSTIKDLRIKLDKSQDQVKKFQDLLLTLCSQGKAELEAAGQLEQDHLAEIEDLKLTVQNQEEELRSLRTAHQTDCEKFDKLLKKTREDLVKVKEDARSNFLSKKAEFLAEIEKLRSGLQQQKKKYDLLKDSLHKRDQEAADVWIKREKSLILKLPSHIAPKDVQIFESLLGAYIEKHKCAIDHSLHLKQWCLEHNVKLVCDSHKSSVSTG